MFEDIKIEILLIGKGTNMVNLNNNLIERGVMPSHKVTKREIIESIPVPEGKPPISVVLIGIQYHKQFLA